MRIGVYFGICDVLDVVITIITINIYIAFFVEVTQCVLVSFFACTMSGCVHYASCLGSLFFCW